MSAEIDWAALAAEARKKIAQWQTSLELAEEMLAASGGSSSITERTPGGMFIAQGAFLGMNIPDAAKRYLEAAKSDQTVRQIADALQQGGLRHVNAKAVYTALWRRKSPDGEFAQPTDNTWGLAEWYRNSPTTKRRVKPASTKQQESGGEKEPPTVTVDDVLRRRRGTSQLDLCEGYLREAKAPQHISILISKLASEADKQTTVHSLSSTLRQDGKKRFENLGRNMWALAEWPEEVKAPFRKKKEAALPLS